MKNRFYQATAVAASTLALSAAMHNSDISELIYDSALAGGAMRASATSFGSFAQSAPVERH